MRGTQAAQTPRTKERRPLDKTASALDRLKWLTVIAPVLFLGVVELVRKTIAPELFQSWTGSVVAGAVVLLCSVIFAQGVFRAIAAVQDRTARQNRELLALHDAGTSILGELDQGIVLQRVVDRARELVDARYGALSLLRDDNSIEAFLTAGISDEERVRIGPLPNRHGLLGVILSDGQPLRMDDLRQHDLSVGFPPNHPMMKSLLAVPIVTQGRVVGTLYVTEKQGAPAFDAADEETLQRFATQAALAIENSRLHRQIQALAITEERERIAREMHDSLAQVLGYVNTKAQAAQVLVRNGERERAADQIGQLAEAARAAYADVRESILGLRTARPVQRGFLAALADYLTLWQDQSGIGVELIAPDELPPRLTPDAEVQLLRIVQEALANVRKHAAAQHARVRLHSSGGWLTVTIEDDGAGFPATTPPRAGGPRFGLATMRERAEAVGGSLNIDSTTGQGARVTVRVPLAGSTGGNHDAGAGS